MRIFEKRGKILAFWQKIRNNGDLLGILDANPRIFAIEGPRKDFENR